jgi:hypothetical protein
MTVVTGLIFRPADAPTGDQPPTPSPSLTVPRDFVADLCGDVRGAMESIAGASWKPGLGGIDSERKTSMSCGL